MTPNDLVKYLCELLNINTNNDLVMEDIIEDLTILSSNHNLNDFRLYIKKVFNYEKHKYLTGYQKFISIKNEFERENKPQLSDEMRNKALTYADNLFKKATYILDELHFELEYKRRNIDEVNLDDTFLRNGLEKHHINILNAIGSKNKLMHLCLYGKEELRLQIDSIVNKKALVKEYTQLANKKSDDVKVLEMVRRGGK